MTLAELIPSVGGMLASRPHRARLEPGIWPAGVRLTSSGKLLLEGVDLAELAARFGTPLCVLAEAAVRHRWRGYQAALNMAGDGAEIACQGSAVPSPEVLRWLDQERMSLVLRSAAELAAARTARFPAARIVLHASGQTPADLKAALAYEVSRIVVTAPEEANRVAALAGRPQPVLLSVAQGVGDIGGADHIMDQARPVSPPSEAVRQVLGQRTLRLAGLHCLPGSQIRSTGVFELAVRRLLGVAAAIRDEYGVCPRCLYLGGSHAAPHPGGGLDITRLATRLQIEMRFECTRLRLPPPLLLVEPGPALMSGAGVILHRAGSAGVGPDASAGIALAGDASLSDLVAMSYAGADEQPTAAGACARQRPAVVAITDSTARLLAPAGPVQLPANQEKQ